MESIISYIAESLFCGAVFFLLFVILVSEKSSYNFQRAYLLVSSLFILIFPIISIPVYSAYNFSITLPEITIVGKGAGANKFENILESNDLSHMQIIYFSIISLFAFIFILQLFKVLYIYYTGEKCSRRGVIVINSSLVKSPFSFFNLVFIQRESDNKDAECAITHEIAHVKRGHSFDIIFISFINTIQWFNPFIYFIKSSLISVHEYQADKDVIMCGYTIKYYQNLMLSTQFGVSPFVTNKLNNSLTIKRLKKMENLNEKKNRIIMFVSVILMTSTLFFVVSCNANKGKSAGSSADKQQTTVQSQTPSTPEVVPPVPPPPVKPSSNEAPATPPPPPPPPSAPKVKAKTSDSDVSENFEAEEVPFTVVEVKPVFMGGDENTFTKWVSERLEYPNEAKEKGIQGRVIVQFLVTDKGQVSNIKVVRGVDKTLDMEAARVVALSPKWTPGKQKGKNVAVRYTFPVIFKLQ